MASCKDEGDRSRWRGWLVVLGGFLIHLTLGLPYTSGNLLPYLSSYFHEYVSPGTKAQDLVWVMGSVSLGHGASMVLGGILEQKLTPKWSPIIGFIVLTGGLVLCSITVQSSIPLLVLTHGICQGIGIGMAYIPPVSLAIQWFPEKKGLVTGCIMSGIGFGAFLFTQIQTLYLNPDNVKVNITTGYFEDEDLLGRVPSMYQLMALIAGGLQLVGWLLLAPPPAKFIKRTSVPLNEMITRNEVKVMLQDEEKKNQSQQAAVTLLNGTSSKVKNYLSPTEAMKTREFYILWLSMFFNVSFVVFLASVYKAFGQTFINNDQYLATVGAIAAVLNSGMRVVWGFLADKYTYKVLMCVLTSSMAILLCTWTLTPMMGKEAFAAWVWAMYMDESGHFTLLPICIAQTFGPKHVGTIYGLVSTSLIANGPFISMLSQMLYPLIGWSGLCFVVAALSTTTFILTLFYRGSHLKKV